MDKASAVRDDFLKINQEVVSSFFDKKTPFLFGVIDPNTKDKEGNPLILLSSDLGYYESCIFVAMMLNKAIEHVVPQEIVKELGHQQIRKIIFSQIEKMMIGNNFVFSFQSIQKNGGHDSQSVKDPLKASEDLGGPTILNLFDKKRPDDDDSNK